MGRGRGRATWQLCECQRISLSLISLFRFPIAVGVQYYSALVSGVRHSGISPGSLVPPGTVHSHCITSSVPCAALTPLRLFCNRRSARLHPFPCPPSPLSPCTGSHQAVLCVCAHLLYEHSVLNLKKGGGEALSGKPKPSSHVSRAHNCPLACHHTPPPLQGPRDLRPPPAAAADTPFRPARVTPWALWPSFQGIFCTSLDGVRKPEKRRPL